MYVYEILKSNKNIPLTELLYINISVIYAAVWQI